MSTGQSQLTAVCGSYQNSWQIQSTFISSHSSQTPRPDAVVDTMFRSKRANVVTQHRKTGNAIEIESTARCKRTPLCTFRLCGRSSNQIQVYGGSQGIGNTEFIGLSHRSCLCMIASRRYCNNGVGSRFVSQTLTDTTRTSRCGRGVLPLYPDHESDLHC